MDTSARLPAQVERTQRHDPPLVEQDHEQTAKVKPHKVYTWTCQYCGQSFPSRSYNARYCSPTHKKYAQRERERAKVSTP